MIFVEELSLRTYIFASYSKERIFYSRKSLLQKVFSRIIPIKKSEAKIEKCDFQILEYTTNIRKNAYENAFDYIQKVDISEWTTKVGELFSIDFDLIFKKYLFDKLYVKYEFIEIAKKYKNGNQENCSINIKKQYSGPYADNLSEFEKVNLSSSSLKISFLLGLMLIPLVLYNYFRTNRTADSIYTNQIVCLVDDHSTYRMFSEIFSVFPNLSFVVEKHNAEQFSAENYQDLRIEVLGITPRAFSDLKNKLWQYIKIVLSMLPTLSKHGLAAFDIFYLLLRGKGLTINGSGNMFVTYEHLETVKAIRNEFLNTNSSISVFIPKNAYTATQYFHSEIFINYTIMCAAGQHTFDLLKKKLAKTDIFLKAGSFDNHRGIINTNTFSERLEILKRFKGDSKIITIISPGICDPTLQHEIKLMLLAKKIAAMPGIRVIIRTKPVQPVSKYADFYERYVKDEKDIKLTNKEFELFDFLTHTDLFITSMSNAASDIALAGGKVLFINFIRDNNLFLFWEKVPSVVIEESEALPRIRRFISEEATNSELLVKNASDELVQYLGYKFDNIDDYKQNLLQQLQPYLPNNTASRQ